MFKVLGWLVRGACLAFLHIILSYPPTRCFCLKRGWFILSGPPVYVRMALYMILYRMAAAADFAGCWRTCWSQAVFAGAEEFGRVFFRLELADLQSEFPVG